MPELRKDPVVDQWVIVSTERARRPGNFVDTSDPEVGEDVQECFFCKSKRDVISSVEAKEGNMSVNVISSQENPLPITRKFRREKHGLYDVVKGFGTHEIVIETPEHVANMADLDVDQIALGMKAYIKRFKELTKETSFQYALAYKNYGSTAGGRKDGHTFSHIVATPVRPTRVKEKLIGAKRYFEKQQRCIYCDLIRQEQEEKKRVILETEHFIALTPFAARFLFEVWILPKKHHCDFTQGVEGYEKDLAVILKKVLQKIQIGLDDPAYNFVFQTAPLGYEDLKEGKWKNIKNDYHWHIELMPRLTRMAGFEKGTGFYICSIPPEEMAQFLREIEV